MHQHGHQHGHQHTRQHPHVVRVDRPPASRHPDLIIFIARQSPLPLVLSGSGFEGGLLVSLLFRALVALCPLLHLRTDTSTTARSIINITEYTGEIRSIYTIRTGPGIPVPPPPPEDGHQHDSEVDIQHYRILRGNAVNIYHQGPGNLCRHSAGLHI